MGKLLMKNKKLISKWKNSLKIRHIVHSSAFSHFKLMDRLLGLITIILSAIVTTTVFVSFGESESRILIAIAGGISVLTTLFAASHSFLNFAELAERHRQAAASFDQLRRDLDSILLNKNIESINHKKLQEMNAIWSELEKTAPSVPQRIYARATNKDTAKKS